MMNKPRTNTAKSANTGQFYENWVYPIFYPQYVGRRGNHGDMTEIQYAVKQ